MKLAQALDEYLSLKQSLGFRYRSEGVILRSFGKTMGPVSLGDITPTDVRSYLDGRGPLTSFWKRKWTTLRGFYGFSLTRNWVRLSPLPEAPPHGIKSFIPYIYTVKELERLLSAIPAQPLAGISSSTFRALLLLLYGAGLRLGEAIQLNNQAVDLKARLLTITQSKFFKTRWVPIGSELVKVLADYDGERPSSLDGPRHPFFFNVRGQPLSRSAPERAFVTLRQNVGIERPGGSRHQPRLHDLRHAFAVHRLIQAYQQEMDVQALLPKLATYLGHVNLTGTQRYLTLTPQLAHYASQRFERYAWERRGL